MYIPFSRTKHVVYPWAWPSHRSYLSQVPPSGGMSTSRVRLLPTGTRTMALKPPFSSLCYCFGLLLNLAMLQPGDALLWRRLLLATPHLDDASPWRRLLLATPHLGDASSSQSVDFLPWTPRVVPLYVDFDFGQRPETGRYSSPPVLS